MRISRLFPAFAVLLLLASPTLAGIVYEIEVKDHEQSPPRTESIQAAVEGRSLKMGVAPERPGERGGEMIFRGDRREVVVVDHDEQGYWVMDEATMQRLAGQVGAAMGAMQDALKNLPPDKRKEVEEAMKRSGMGGVAEASPRPPAAEVRKTGERATHGGYPCVRYEVLRDGRKIRELWVTDWSNVKGGDEARKAFQEMADFFKAMMDAMPGGAAGFAGEVDRFTDHFKDGFPVVTRSFDERGGLEDESTLRGATERDLDPDAFEPPKGYRLRTMGPQ